MFEPNRVDAITGGSNWQAPLGHIAGVSRQPPDGNAFSGGLRSRLRLDLADGSVELFVVNHLDESSKYRPSSSRSSVSMPIRPASPTR
ncbi:MAG: hypothetical protein ACRDRJ_33560 [Streptosporangiaceae bacterium]